MTRCATPDEREYLALARHAAGDEPGALAALAEALALAAPERYLLIMRDQPVAPTRTIRAFVAATQGRRPKTDR